MSDSIPEEAQHLHEQGREAGRNGDPARALDLLNQARLLAPDWPYPPYDMAFTYLLHDHVEEAERWYATVDALAPRGFFTAKTALDTIRRERRGELFDGFSKAFALLESRPTATSAGNPSEGHSAPPRSIASASSARSTTTYVTDHAGLTPEALRNLTRQVGSFGSLQEVLRWGFSQSPPCEVAEVVVQDEFTHDVVIEWAGRYLVFDTT